MESPLSRIHIYMYIHIYAPRGKSSRRRPAGSVSGRSCSKIEGRRDRKLHPTADQAVPGGSPGAGTSRRNSKFKFKHTRDVLSSFLSDLAPSMKLVHRFDLRQDWRPNKYADACRPTRTRVYVDDHVERVVMYPPPSSSCYEISIRKRKKERESERETERERRCNLVIF